ncbi:unnamed protein product [Polarella glacialis]|uniref:Pseudouridine synthase RsuA/RluA-like domain-containing protein n=1 Tax=Polarella glacialis TaxID=89957 RepID=A0A813E1G1_POLGL|nr:unnamed protein product [Polarella glacialis]
MLAPDAISYNSAISACAKKGCWEFSVALLGIMPDPDRISYNSAISACEKGFQWQLALRLLHGMPAKSLSQDAISFNSAISACEKGGQWQVALSLLKREIRQRRVSPDVVSYNAVLSACEKGGAWQEALGLLSLMAEALVTPDVVSWSAAISSCAAGSQWQLALGLLSEMTVRRVMPNEFSYSSAIAACDKGGCWPWALSLLDDMARNRVRQSIIGCNTAISACDKGGQWQLALLLLHAMPDLGLTPNEISYNAALSACDRGRQWELALKHLSAMSEMLLRPDDISFTAAISACEKCGKVGEGLALLREFKDRDVAYSLAFVPWALARLNVEDPEVIDAAFTEAAQRLEASTHSPRELSTLAWASAMLGRSHEEGAQLFRSLSEQVIQQIRDFQIEDLMLVAWGASASASDANLSRKFADCILGVLWACSFGGTLSEEFLAAARRQMRRFGRALDGTRLRPELPVRMDMLPVVAKDQLQSEPAVVLDLSDRLVVFKPPDWEVADQHTELQLSSYLQALLGQGNCPILHDAEHGCGFLHRLDVPSSGLILAAKTYEAFYDLQVQMATGQVERDYVILCRGWVPPALSHIRAQVSWREEIANAPLETLGVKTRAGARGKPAQTRLKVLALASHEVEALSLVAVRISTGRRHQIRSHFAHVGHPTVRDGKYTASATFQSDLALCERNFLHRYRLAFKDAAELRREVVVPVPEDLLEALRAVGLEAKGPDSAQALDTWLSGLGPRDWDEYKGISAEQVQLQKYFKACVLSALVPDPLASAGCKGSVPEWLERGSLASFSHLEVDDALLFGHRRSYSYHVPEYSGRNALPIVFDFHGYYDDAKSEAHEDAVMRESARYGFISVFPRAWADFPKGDKWGSSAWGGPGLDGTVGRYGPGCDKKWAGNYPCYRSCEALGRCGSSMQKGLVDCHSGPCIDDDKFVDVLFQHILSHFCVDRSRVHATGVSDGAIFLYGLIGRSRLGDFGASLASAVLVEGSVPLGFLHSPVSPIAIMDIHGTHDHCVPGNVSNSYKEHLCPVKAVGPRGCVVSDDFYYYTPVGEILALWGLGNRCSDASLPFNLDVGEDKDYVHYPTQQRFDGGKADFWCASRSLSSLCQAPVVWCTHNGKHDWPWAPDEKHPSLRVAHHHRQFAKMMWWFMSQHRQTHLLGFTTDEPESRSSFQ